MQIVADGYDPNIGYLHTSNPDRPALVFDLMEPLRPIVDRAILHFVQSHTFDSADFATRSDGVCRLNPEMARHVVRLATTKIAVANSDIPQAGVPIRLRGGSADIGLTPGYWFGNSLGLLRPSRKPASPS
jgi:CRISPR/Cas system-associated endonuclease Cas1